MLQRVRNVHVRHHVDAGGIVVHKIFLCLNVVLSWKLLMNLNYTYWGSRKSKP